MELYKTRKASASAYSIPAAKGFGGRTSDSFQQHLGQKLKEDYRKRAAALFDEIGNDAAGMIDHIDLLSFERYRGLICDFLSEVVKNAYSMSSNLVLDYSGRQRLYATVNIIDRKLEDMAIDILERNGEHLDYISRVDEIRGLVMDLLL